MSRPILGYWDIRGLAQSIRHMLVYVGVDFEDKEYKYGPAPDFDKKNWTDVKYTLGLDFPNLPYYIDGDLKITQSDAILMYISRKYGLHGQTEEEKIRIDTLNGVLMDFFVHDFFSLIQGSSKLADFKEKLPEKLKVYSDYLGTRPWLAGDKISYIDFKWYEMFKMFNKVDPGCVDKFDNLKKLVKKFEELPAIEKYLKSPNYRHGPITRIFNIPGDN